MMGTAVAARLTGALTIVFAVLTTACAHVGQEDFDAEIAALRAELNDRGVGIESRNSAQIAALSATHVHRSSCSAMASPGRTWSRQPSITSAS